MMLSMGNMWNDEEIYCCHIRSKNILYVHGYVSPRKVKYILASFLNMLKVLFFFTLHTNVYSMFRCIFGGKNILMLLGCNGFKQECSLRFKNILYGTHLSWKHGIILLTTFVPFRIQLIRNQRVILTFDINLHFRIFLSFSFILNV